MAGVAQSSGILRHIQYRSKADIASDAALDQAAGSSFGYIRFVSEWPDPTTFDQELRIVAVLDPMSIYGVLVPKCLGREPRHAFVIETISKTEYGEMYGDEDGSTDWESSEWQAAGDWLDGDNVRIAGYWKVKDKRRTLRGIQNPKPGGAPIPVYTDDADYSEDMPFVLAIAVAPPGAGESDVFSVGELIAGSEARAYLPLEPN